jgi:sensor histidine kinase regulating citrate/malate metabolism
MQQSTTPKKSLLHQLLMSITSLIVVILVLVTAAISFHNAEHLNTDLESDISQLKAQLEDKGRILSRQINKPINQNLSPLNLSALQQELNQLVAENNDLDFAILMSKERTAYAHTLRPEFQTRRLNDDKSLQLASALTPQTLEYRTLGNPPFFSRHQK